MAKNIEEFAKFLKDEVNLNQGRMDRLETAVRWSERLPEI